MPIEIGIVSIYVGLTISILDGMRKILFLVASLFIAGSSFISSASERVSSVIIGRSATDVLSEQEDEPLILEKAIGDISIDKLGHRSHSSHSSHRSHYSSR